MDQGKFGSLFHLAKFRLRPCTFSYQPRTLAYQPRTCRALYLVKDQKGQGVHQGNQVHRLRPRTLTHRLRTLAYRPRTQGSSHALLDPDPVTQ